MSSEEVAELAQAIHSHADALYESWTKGPAAVRRMEDTLAKDTLELLAEPGLGKLEHLVSSFVRRDKAKRQQHTIIAAATNNPSRVHHQSPPPKSQESSSESIQNNNITSSGKNSSSIPVHASVNGGDGVHKKPLPRSILAVVQRFEQPSSSSAKTSSPPSSVLPVTVVDNNNSITSIHHHHQQQHHHPLPTSESIISTTATSSVPAAGNGQRMTIAGVGKVSKNIVWAESSNRHTVTEKNLRIRHTTPPSSPSSTTPPSTPTTITPCGVHDDQSLPSRSMSRSISPSTPSSSSLSRERHIPIERADDSSPTLSSGQPSSRVMNLSKVETTQNVKVMKNHCPGSKSTGSGGGVEYIQELEREEERLFQALRTGHIIPVAGHIGHNNANSNANNSDNNITTTTSAPAVTTTNASPFDAIRERASSPLNSSSRIAFAKERIRQSQEHPLTQQRLELQKRLPSPSSSLAAAIAVQQGKIKFQPVVNGDGHSHTDEHHHPHHHHHHSHDYHHHHHPKENGRQSWVSSMLRSGNGASVADRVQLFEKYPAHMVTPTAALLSQNSSFSSLSPMSSSPSPSTTIHHPINISSSNSNNSTPSAHNVSIINVSMASRDDGISPPSSSTCPPSAAPKLTPSITAPWRGIPIEHYQSDTIGSSAKKQKQSVLTTKPVYPPTINKTVIKQPVPRFYWPEGGKPPTAEFVQEAVSKADEVMSKFPPFLTYLHLSQILPLIGIPLFWKRPLWTCLGLKNEDLLNAKRFLKFYHRLMADCPDDAARFLFIMSAAGKRRPPLSTVNKRDSVNELEFTFTDFHKMYLAMSDFIPMMQDIIDTHIGLGFLRDAPEFHSRYITTVISRIFYKVNRFWTERITLSELRRSNLLRIIKRLEEETDINLITEYFSYEHFYVIYCKFWELDKDHDLLIDKKDLNAHGDYALSSRIIDRIFDGTVIRGWDVASPVKCTPGKMTYSDFVWFLLSEEDKKTPTAIEFWFRCLDIDGDGILSPYELQFFYQEQESRIESYGIEPLDFSNIYCQMVDMLRCSPTGIRLKDLKKNPQLAATVFNTIFNLDKYLDHEQRDPFATAASNGGGLDQMDSDWDKYAAAEYENLISEESPSDHNMLENSDVDDSGVVLYEAS